MTGFHVYEPRAGHGLAHDPLNSIVAPRPIGWISSRSTGGIHNLAPYSFFNLFNYQPPIIGFASVGWKDSVENIKTTGEFVWNLVTGQLAEAMNATSAAVPATRDEFELAQLTPAPAKLVRAPRVAESPVSFECRLSQLLRLTDSKGLDTDSWLVLG
jgi:flavin reductase (DIM6/NTAB) family NADH-FMN oxidoreductase RutF